MGMPGAMTQPANRTGRVSSAAATGGVGTFFEQHVNAHWLALLLTGAIPPILLDSTVVEVRFQTEHWGHNTDDFLVIAESSAGTRRRLAGQVKRSFTVSTSDKECKKAFIDFWTDCIGSQNFSPATDRFALVVLRGSNSLLENFAGLLNLAQSVPDDGEFERRLTVPGLINAKAVEYCNTIRTIVGNHERRAVSAREVWPLLRVLHVLSLDLNTPTKQTEAHIKSLLAHTTHEADALGAAEATWTALLHEVGEGMPWARSYRREDLPEALQQRHSSIDVADRRTLQALVDRSGLILTGIRSTIGSDVHLPRSGLVELVLNRLESAQIVLLSGSAGSGKSAIAKDVVGLLAKDHFAFCFRADELACPSLDETLQRGQIQFTASKLGAVLAGQAQKVLLIESVERLLEASTRDAFTDLLTLVARDKGWRLIVTCRDYSSDLVRSCFLQGNEAVHAIVNVPPLEDDEVAEVVRAYPALTTPLGSPHLRTLLRIPYILDKARLIAWGDDRPLPLSEREFRDRFWRDIVRADHRAAPGMPLRRENVFGQVALRRARALALHCNCADLDAEVLDGLRNDSLVVTSPQHAGLVAPAHDVLEDWAILRWVDEQHAACHGSATELAAALGTYPALRRTLRKYVGELVESDREAADALFQAAVSESTLPAHFRDDLLVALLQSPGSTAFLGRHASRLFANGKRLLHRVIHLQRVACVKTPVWLLPASSLATLFHAPDGAAWPCVLGLVQAQLGSFSAGERLLLLGLIEDWAQGVSWQTPYPAGAEAASAIGYELLQRFNDYRDEEQRRRTLRVLAKIPNADPEPFSTILRGGAKGGPRSHLTEDLREIVLEGMEGMPACRDLPDGVIEVAREHLLCAEEDLGDPYGIFSADGVETLFGIRPSADRDYFPASAYRGPFLPLLRCHLQKGLAFILAMVNHSADWYAHPRVLRNNVEPPFEITLTFANEVERKQSANWRLWGLYRGMTVGPYVLQSALMALEQRLLETAEANPEGLDTLLLDILRQSDSVAVTAVVASVATMHPQLCGESLLVLLGTPEFVLLDRVRLSQESGIGMFRLFPRLNATNDLYREERKQADERSHRRQDLQIAIVNIQFGPLAPRVHQLLDRHLAELPPVEVQDEDDKPWRLALHRMDLRQYSVADQQSESPAEGSGTATGGTQVRLTLNEPDLDLQKTVRASESLNEAMNASLGLLNWGRSVFERELSRGYDPDEWRERLALARGGLAEADEIVQDLGSGSAGFIAAVCVRDHWEEMSEDERRWCMSTAIEEVERDADNWNEVARVQRGMMKGDRPSAWILATLLGKTLRKDELQRVLRTLAIALTHAVDEVRANAAAGAADALWRGNRDLALRCVALITVEAVRVQQAVALESSKPPLERRPLDAIEAEAALAVRPRFTDEQPIPEGFDTGFDPAGWVGAEANVRILTILSGATTEPAARKAYVRLASTLVTWWDSDDDRQKRQERKYDVESTITNLLIIYLLRAPEDQATEALQPILAAVNRHVREVSFLLLGLIGREESHPNTTQFWMLWGLFAQRVLTASWLPHIDDEHATGDEMVIAIFLGTWWKEGVHHWMSLDGHAHHVHTLFESLPTSATVLDDYVRFLYHVGERSLPEAFSRITDRLSAGDPSRMLSRRNTVILLERLLERHVYGRPLELKRNRRIQAAVLDLLDRLVELGSSAAFRMRDDFVTPLPVG